MEGCDNATQSKRYRSQAAGSVAISGATFKYSEAHSGSRIVFSGSSPKRFTGCSSGVGTAESSGISLRSGSILRTSGSAVDAGRSAA